MEIQTSHPLRALPAIGALLEDPLLVAAAPEMPRAVRRAIIRGELEALRLQNTPPPPLETLRQQLIAAIQRATVPSYQPVINASGVLLHTNLGRAPLSAAAVDYVKSVVDGYCNLEYDLERAERGSREAHVRWLLTLLTGGEAALVVNNAAAALHLILNCFCGGRAVAVSRGELIEIGDGFRLHEIIAASGAVLREVGSTNRTHLKDYEQALQADVTPKVEMIFKAHTSNYQIVGFTETPSVHELAALAHQHGVPLCYDAGSVALGTEPALTEFFAAGADLVCFSGDKLLGGPQVGVIVGTTAAIERLRCHPLYRALRLDKVNLALLDWTLSQYAAGNRREIPLVTLLERTAEERKALAEELLQGIAPTLTKAGLVATLESSTATVGGGSLPGSEVTSWGVRVDGDKVVIDQLDRFLRTQNPAIVARRDSGLFFDTAALLDSHQLEIITRNCGSFVN